MKLIGLKGIAVPASPLAPEEEGTIVVQGIVGMVLVELLLELAAPFIPDIQGIEGIWPAAEEVVPPWLMKLAGLKDMAAPASPLPPVEPVNPPKEAGLKLPKGVAVEVEPLALKEAGLKLPKTADPPSLAPVVPVKTPEVPPVLNEAGLKENAFVAPEVPVTPVVAVGVKPVKPLEAVGEEKLVTPVNPVEPVGAVNPVKPVELVNPDGLLKTGEIEEVPLVLAEVYPAVVPVGL